MTDEPPVGGEPSVVVAPEVAAEGVTTGEIAARDGDGPLLPPAAVAEAELRAAVSLPPEAGAPSPKVPAPEPDDEDGTERKPHRSGRAAFVAGGLLLVSLAVGTLVLLGHLNAERYEIACAPDEIRAQRGRAFPPWGARELTGGEWKAIAIPADAECKPRDTDSESELAGWFLDLLVERAEKSLLARDPLQAEVAAAQLQQALLLARAPERRDQRKTVERLMGDVEYWRATAKLAAARAQLAEAAKQFDAAAAQLPRHVTDAAAWAKLARQLVDEAVAGPAGVHTGPAGPPPEHVGEHPVLPGVALPVEPSSAAAPASPPPGVPAGGILL